MTPSKEPLIFINPVRRRNKSSCFLWTAARSLLAMQLFIFFELLGLLPYMPWMDSQLTKVYYSPKGIAAIKKLVEAAKVPKETAKQWLIRQAFWQIYLLHLATFLAQNFMYQHPTWSTKQTFFFCHTPSCYVIARFTKCTLTVVDMASWYTETEPLTSKDSTEVAKAFQLIYKQCPLKWPCCFKSTPSTSLGEIWPKR